MGSVSTCQILKSIDSKTSTYWLKHIGYTFIVKMQNISDFSDVSGIFICYCANIHGMQNARKLGWIYKILEFTLT